jgi:putative iron-regulated protein
MKNFKNLLAICILTSTLISCSDDDTTGTGNGTGITQTAVIENYANIVYSSYQETYDSAVEMQTKIDAFVTAPSENTFAAAKEAWLVARDFYGQTEVYRGSNGPVDLEGNETWAINNEGQLNAWPLDEGYIDYVKTGTEAYAGDFSGGIIAGDQAITKALLSDKNEGGGSVEGDAAGKAISTGWHAIEFLLWGQDETLPSEKKAGLRPYTDYVITSNQERKTTINVIPLVSNQERRGEYLKVVTALLVDDLKLLVDTWVDGGQYNQVFLGLSKEDALKNIILGPHFLASEELSNERMLASATSDVGINNSGQEDEHSCFSDNTHRDVYTNALGIMNVLFGNYKDGSIEGASIYDLVKQEDEAQAAKLKAAADKAWAAIVLIDDTAKAGTPYDLMIVNEGENNPGIVLDGNQDLLDLGDVISESVLKLGITLD